MKTSHALLAGAGSLLAVNWSFAAAPKADAQKPNVLLIVMDDMCDWMSYLGGNNQANTPNVDRLASQGVWFSNAYAAVPVSNPSRTALMTGLQPFVTGVYNNEHQLVDSQAVTDCVMMPEHFHNNGYTTLWSGKIFHNKPARERLDGMWDDWTHFDGGYGPWVRNSTVPQKLYVDKWRDFDPWDGPDTDFPDVVNSRRVMDFLGEEHDKPFFVAMGLYRPHTPYTAPKRYFDMYPLDKIERPEVPGNDLDDLPQYAIDRFIGQKQIQRHDLWAEAGLWEKLVQAYLACTTFSDEIVGNILTALADSDYADNTIVVLIGDNGFHIGEKKRFGKAALWRKSCHVPFVVSLPEPLRSRTGEASAPVSLIDIYPTLVSLCGLPQVDALAGNDIGVLLSDPQAPWDKPCISTMNPGNFVIHAGKWNYLRYADGSCELYDVSADEKEYRNLAGSDANAGIVKKLDALLPSEWHPGLEPRTVDRDLTRITFPRN